MKRLLMALLALMLMMSGACAEVFYNVALPEDWTERTVMTIVMMDTDRTDAMLLMAGGEAMLVDGGTKKYVPVLEETLDRYGVKQLKYLFSTHSDNDHIQGLNYLMMLEKYEIGMFTSPVKETYVDQGGYHQSTVETIQRLGIPYHIVEDREILTLGDATIEVLRCMEEWGHNARSACCRVTFGDCAILLTGDIDNRTMYHFADKYPAEVLQAQVVKAPHHGLATMPEEFMEAVSPAVVLVNNKEKDAPKIKNNMKKYEGVITLFSGEGQILLETDGTDWYVFHQYEEE